MAEGIGIPVVVSPLGAQLAAAANAAAARTLLGISAGGNNQYVHTQNSPDTTWTIDHNLGEKRDWDIFNTADQKIGALVTNVNDNQTIVEFNAAMAGYAIGG